MQKTDDIMPFGQRLRKDEKLAQTMIRQAEVSDYERVRDLLVSAGLTTNDFFTRERFTDTLRDFGKYNLVAEKGDKVVGYVFGFDDSGKSGKAKFYGYMGRLVVDPDYRNQGIGKRLTEGRLAEFKKSGYEVIFAGVRRDNAASRRILKNFGFKDDDFSLVYYE